jgi:hypothetical protein
MGAVCLNAYRLFLLLFTVWGGSGMFESLGAHASWWRDPVAYAAFPALPGAFNPWPLLTVLVLAALLVSAATTWRYRGPGRGAALASQAIAAAILLATFGYFVPELGRMFGEGRTLTEAQLVTRSHAWIVLNAVRIAIVLATAYGGLVALGRFARG